MQVLYTPLMQLHYSRISLASVLRVVLLSTGYAGIRDRHLSRALFNTKYVQGLVSLQLLQQPVMKLGLIFSVKNAVGTA